MVEVGGKCVGTPGRPKGGICSGQPVCNRCSTGELGIKYGSCYTLQFPEGGFLGRDRAGTDYKKDGYFSDIPYKICASKDAACAAKKGQYVKIGEDFSMMDTLGLYTDPTGKPGWVGNQAGGAHKLFVYDANTAGEFRAKPGCLGCSLCFMGLTTGIGMACPVDKPGFTEYGNPNICQQYFVAFIKLTLFHRRPTHSLSLSISISY
ncbi:hypothetical protein GQ42DRAFT_93323 [Ramicandelaber brevisporus]|nr:hypothetical protein GQ42DRAFT_93323 [Ramicandelaber brevisporus]